MRGGVSSPVAVSLLWKEFSPRAWRCFRIAFFRGQFGCVFSTCVEVFLCETCGIDFETSFLHVRGGVSLLIAWYLLDLKFSPRAWRCFLSFGTATTPARVFSTCVEVFLQAEQMPELAERFLHVRGGVSGNDKRAEFIRKFSPRAWRCFSRKSTPRQASTVFSTCVEVFLMAQIGAEAGASFLHVRGGVSPLLTSRKGLSMFSPRAWRCFRRRAEAV